MDSPPDKPSRPSEMLTAFDVATTAKAKIKIIPTQNEQLQLDKSHVLVAMNKVMDGGELLYCLDDGEWKTYTNTVAIPANTNIVKAKVLYCGKESNTTWLWLQDQHQVNNQAQEKNTGATF